MQFSRELRALVADGTITVSYRLWTRPQVRTDGIYATAGVWIEIDEIDLVPFSSITDEDLALTGERDRERLRCRAAHAGPIDDDTLLHRVEFHVVDPPHDSVP
ncbi:MAG: ASCH domain-containing protein [Ilumatobacteraceae bacterium]